MTPTNRTDEVRKIASELVFAKLPWDCQTHWHRDVVRGELVEAITSAITSAVEAETERCAKVAEHQATICGSSMSRQTTAHDIAFNIRQTPTKEGV